VGAYINAIEFSRLPSSDRRCTVHAVAYSECGHLHANSDLLIVERTPAEIEEWKKDCAASRSPLPRFEGTLQRSLSASQS